MFTHEKTNLCLHVRKPHTPRTQTYAPPLLTLICMLAEAGCAKRESFRRVNQDVLRTILQFLIPSRHLNHYTYTGGFAKPHSIHRRLAGLDDFEHLLHFHQRDLRAQLWNIHSSAPLLFIFNRRAQSDTHLSTQKQT